MTTRPDYRPDIDGLRAISVLLVLFFHLDTRLVPGGFLGVDVFFVISGYLMTRIIVEGNEAGSFSPMNFYARRARRILPALLVLILFTLALGYKLLAPGEYEALGQSALAAAASVSNVFFYFNTGYFDGDAALKPLLHTWSLGVEEQFYLIWPLLLMAVWRVSRSRSAAAILVAACIVVSVAAMLVASSAWSFYWLPARLWELAAGGLIVFFKPSPLARYYALPGVTLIIASAALLRETSPGSTVAPVLGAMLVIAGGQGNFAARTLALPPLVWLGRISYSLYLWHWPIIVFWKEYNNDPLAVSDGALIVALSIAAAFLSWRFIEQPFRRRRGKSVRVLGASFASIALVGAAGYLVVSADGFPARMPEELKHLGDPKLMWYFNCPRLSGIEGLGCEVGQPWASAGARGLLWGDSHAAHLLAVLDVAGRGTDRSIALMSACSPPLGRRVKSTAPFDYQIPERCAKDRAAGFDLLRQHPEITFVILASRMSSVLEVLHTDNEPGSIAHGLELIKADMQETIAELRAMGRQVLLVSDAPSFAEDHNPIPCASLSATPLWRNKTRTCARSIDSIPQLQIEARQGGLSKLYADLARSNEGVFSLSLSNEMCKDGRCPAYIGGQFIYSDSAHLRRDLPPEVIAEESRMMGWKKILGRLGVTSESTSLQSR